MERADPDARERTPENFMDAIAVRLHVHSRSTHRIAWKEQDLPRIVMRGERYQKVTSPRPDLRARATVSAPGTGVPHTGCVPHARRSFAWNLRDAGADGVGGTCDRGLAAPRAGAITSS